VAFTHHIHTLNYLFFRRGDDGFLHAPIFFAFLAYNQPSPIRFATGTGCRYREKGQTMANDCFCAKED